MDDKGPKPDAVAAQADKIMLTEAWHKGELVSQSVPLADYVQLQQSLDRALARLAEAEAQVAGWHKVNDALIRDRNEREQLLIARAAEAERQRDEANVAAARIFSDAGRLTEERDAALARVEELLEHPYTDKQVEELRAQLAAAEERAKRAEAELRAVVEKFSTPASTGGKQDE